MAIKITFTPEKPDTVLQNLILKLPDGKETIIGWRDPLIQDLAGDGSVTMLCRPELESSQELEFQDLAKSKIIRAAWYGPEGPFDGGIKSIQAWAVDQGRCIVVPMAITAKSFPSKSGHG